MLIMGKAVLAFGVFSVFGAAVHNHNQVAGLPVADSSNVAALAPAPAVEEAGLVVVRPASTGLPRGYWSNPATSPLQGIGLPAIQPSGPIRHVVAWQAETRLEFSSDGFPLAPQTRARESY